MARDYKCPYLIDTKGGKPIRCEIAIIKPPDEQARADFLDGFCGGGDSYFKCPFYKILDSYYKRKYDDWEGVSE